ncbi:hypothetical protein RIEGSTA812A_PEG_1277 [invertebrate metagenome]|uniref:Uncharacterized protein n=1 Tax=invertebrate metagenome TaxID=1711999 RepID=A0A484H7R9_9ZZZZ
MALYETFEQLFWLYPSYERAMPLVGCGWFCLLDGSYQTGHVAVGERLR